MTRKEINELNPIQPYCFETDREEDWYKCGLVEGADIADKTMIEKACEWLRPDMFENHAFQGRIDRIDEVVGNFRKAMEEYTMTKNECEIPPNIITDMENSDVKIAREDVIEVLREELPDLISDVAKHGYMPFNCPDEETDCVRTAENFIENLKLKL